MAMWVGGPCQTWFFGCRFVCRQLLGGSQGAALLSAVPENAVVYGSGNSAKVLSLVRYLYLIPARLSCVCKCCECIPVAISPAVSCIYICSACNPLTQVIEDIVDIRPVNISWKIFHFFKDCPGIVLQVQARMLQSASMAEFAVLKSRLLVANACLVALGAGLAYACAGAEAALPFSLGMLDLVS